MDILVGTSSDGATADEKLCSKTPSAGMAGPFRARAVCPAGFCRVWTLLDDARIWPAIWSDP